MGLRVTIASSIAICILLSIMLVEPRNSIKTYKQYTSLQLPLFSEAPFTEKGEGLQSDRVNWQTMRLADPQTGEIPSGIRKREIAYAHSIQSDIKQKNNTEFNWTSMGPYNVGGRTRAMAIDVTNENVIFAGGVSGGLWRSVNSGQSWTKVTDPQQHHSITCIAQDIRPGKTNIWYYGTGESYGNSASKSFSAFYLGNGVYKSTDGGLTWDTLGSTVTGTPENVDLWDKIWRIALDPSVDSLDIIYAALEKKIYRSDDGGLTWMEVLNGTGLGYIFTDIQVSSTGIAYATLSSSADDKGIWRSADHGLSWTKISAGSGWPSNYNRIVMAISPSDQNTVYFLANTPNNGQMSEVFFGGTDWNSLWKYTYVSGNGADTNGIWTDLSMNIPANGLPMDNFNAQGSYNLVVAVKPDDPNTVFIGGTNLYRSTDGFTSTNNTTHIGGYDPGSTIPFYEVYPNHHPDNHALLFLPSDNNILISATDGGVYKTLNCSNQLVSWESLLNGYVTSQFYTIAIDHGTDNSQVIFGGLQDNGTWWTNSSDPTALWTMPSAGDGSYCAVEDGGGVYYFSRQRGRVIKTILDQNGIPTSFRRMDPITTDTINGGNYLFINPFILDPTDNNIMYLSEGTNMWRNDSLSSISLTNEYDTISTGWTKMTNLAPITNTYITALSCSETNPSHRLYYGIYNRKIYRVDSAHTGNPYSTEITNNITSGGFTSCIAIDPRDANKVMVVYSNYNVYSLYYSEDGGNYWMKVGGNLETGPPPGAPPSLDYLGDGPSCRWAEIIPCCEDSTLFVLATSVGLFTTHELIDESISTDSTIWIPQAANTIGNVVVDMIDYRDSDGFLVVGTHGTGVYSTKIKEDTSLTLALSTPKSSIHVNVYPNPTSNNTNIEFAMAKPGTSSLKVFNNSGKCVIGPMTKKLNKGKQQLKVKLEDLPNGVYFIRLELDSQFHSIKVLKH